MIALRINKKNEQMGMIKIGVAKNDDQGIQTLQVNRIKGLQSIKLLKLTTCTIYNSRGY